MKTGTSVDELIELVKKSFMEQGLSEFTQRSGSVLYSGLHTLKKGDYYIMGLNPGGKDGPSLLDSIRNSASWDLQTSAYQEKNWRENSTDLVPHQRRVHKIAELLGSKVWNIFSANAIFIRSRDAGGIAGTEFSKLEEACFSVHKYFLSIVQPKAIICLGNGCKLSSFSILQSRFKHGLVQFIDKENMDYRHGKYFDAKISVRNCETFKCRVVGIPHPSRFDMTEKLKCFLKNEVRTVEFDRDR
jgi:hypothetical protein